MRARHILLAASFLMAAKAHPLGNFSVNHYSRIEPGLEDVRVQYVMDLAEIPTFELLRDWGLESSSARADLDRKALEQARLWAANLAIRIDGKVMPAIVQGTDLVLANGAGNLPIARISSTLRIVTQPGRM